MMPLTHTRQLVTLCAVWALTGCPDPGFTEPQMLGGVEVAADTLNHGKLVYRRYCSSCHGTDGKGSRLSAGGKAPRDLTAGFYKFTSVRGDALPTDDDLTRVIKRGIKGTQMGPHDLPEADISAVVQYLKTFAPRWADEAAGEPIPTSDNPWEGDRMGAIARGYEVYHAEAQCWACHPAYANSEQLLNMSRSLDRRLGEPERKSLKIRDNVHSSALVDTRYGKVLPPDFLSDRLPAAQGRAGLYRAIAAGIGGTPMPTWVDRLSNQDLWAVVHYVQELVRLRGTSSAASMRYGLPAAVSTRSRGRANKASPGQGN